MQQGRRSLLHSPGNTLSLTLYQRFRGYTVAQFSNCFLGCRIRALFYIALRPVKLSALSLRDLIPRCDFHSCFHAVTEKTTFPYSVKQAQSRQSTCRGLRLRTCVRQEWKHSTLFPYGCLFAYFILSLILIKYLHCLILFSQQYNHLTNKDCSQNIENNNLS